MKTVALLCNVVLVGFTGLVVATDGAPTAPVYVAFTLLVVLIPLFTIFVLAATRSRRAWTPVPRITALCNIALVGFAVWAIVDQYPHPAEPGLVPFTALLLLTPILSAFTLLRRGRAAAAEIGV